MITTFLCNRFIQKSIFSILFIIVIFSNIKYIEYSVSINFISITVTMLSIIFGFFISSILNLFGRRITKEMLKRESKDFVKKNKVSQLVKFNYDLKIVVRINSTILFLSFLLILIIELFYDNSTFSFYDINYLKISFLALNAIYVFMVFYSIISMFKFFKKMLILLTNESSFDLS